MAKFDMCSARMRAFAVAARNAGWALALAVCFRGLAVSRAQEPGQEPAGSASAPAASRPAPKGKLTAWPAVPKDDKERVATDVERLRKARTAEMGTQARDALIADGACVVPALLPALDKETDEAALERVREVLLAVIGEEHTRLLAKEFEGKPPAVREFCLWRAAAFPDKELRAAAEKALARARTVRARDSTPGELYAAALAAASAGSPQGLDVLLEAAKKEWGKKKSELRVALEGARGKEATAKLAPAVNAPERQTKVAALNLLAGCGDRATGVPLVRPFLDQNDGGLLVAAINALRGIVDGQEPIDQLPIFEAVEQANKWKERL